MNNLKRNLVENYKEQLNESIWSTVGKYIAPAVRFLTNPSGVVPKIVDPAFDLTSKGLRRVGMGSKGQKILRTGKYATRAAGRAAAVGIPAYMAYNAMIGPGSEGVEREIGGRSLGDEARGMGLPYRETRERRKERKRKEAIQRGLDLSTAAEIGSPEELIVAKVGTSNRARAIAANIQKEKLNRTKARLREIEKSREASKDTKKGIAATVNDALRTMVGIKSAEDAEYDELKQQYDAQFDTYRTVKPIAPKSGYWASQRRIIVPQADITDPDSPEGRVIADIKARKLNPIVLRTSEPSHQRAIRAVEAEGITVPKETTRADIERRGNEAAAQVLGFDPTGMSPESIKAELKKRSTAKMKQEEDAIRSELSKMSDKEQDDFFYSGTRAEQEARWNEMRKRALGQ